LQELRSFLGAIFSPVLKDCYQEVLVLPPVDDIHITPDRVSLVICEPCPGGGLHPDLRKFYEALDYKNRILFLNGKALITSEDARHVGTLCDVWLTDPPYADAINYHELSEFFLAWYEKHLQRLFPDWYTDSKRALANTGSDESFRKSMVDCYRNLVAHMPDNGCQIVMFTHQNASVWAGLALILWAAGLRVIAAWTIATETAQLSKRVTTCKAQSSSSCASKPLTIRPSSMNSILKSNTR
jgi:adenine-specific DNA methylase